MNKKKQLAGHIARFIFFMFLFPAILLVACKEEKSSGGKTTLRLYTNSGNFFRLELPDAIVMERVYNYWGWSHFISRDYLFYTEEYPKIEKGVSLGGKVGNPPFAIFSIHENQKTSDIREAREEALFCGYEFYEPGTLSKEQIYPISVFDAYDWYILTPEGTGNLRIIDPERDDLNEKNKKYILDIVTGFRMEPVEEKEEYQLPFSWPETWGMPLNQYDKSILDARDLVYFTTELGKITINPKIGIWRSYEPELMRIIAEEARNRYGSDAGKISDDIALDVSSCFDLLENDYFPDPRIRKERTGNKLILSLDLEFDETGKFIDIADEQTLTGRFLFHRLVVTPMNIHHVNAFLTAAPGDEEVLQRIKNELDEMIASISDTILWDWVHNYPTIVDILPAPRNKQYTVDEYPRLTWPVETAQYEWVKITNEGEPYSLEYDPEEDLIAVIRDWPAWDYRPTRDSSIIFTWYDENGALIKEERGTGLTEAIFYQRWYRRWRHSEQEFFHLQPWEQVVNCNARPLRAVRRNHLIIPDLIVSENGVPSYTLQWNADLFYEIPHEQDTFKFSVQTLIGEPLSFREEPIEWVIPFPPGYKGDKNILFIEMTPENNKDDINTFGPLYIIRRKE